MKRRDFLVRSSLAVSAGLLSRSWLLAQPSTPAAVSKPPTVAFKRVRGDVGLFTGRGGTIGWLVNTDGIVAVDAQFPETAALFLDQLPGRAGRSLDVLINTHHHGDHTGGNGVFRSVTTAIVGHANVPSLQRLAAERAKQPVDKLVSPDVTFAETWSRRVGDETISGRYFGAAHTKGDIVVHFERANVVHLGDLLFNRIYPVIDRPGGANIGHWIEVLEAIARTYPEDALYVFGHGSEAFGVTGTKGDLFVFRDFLSGLLAHTQGEIAAGKTRDQIVTLENLPGFPEFHQKTPNRLAADLGVAFDELTAPRS